MSKEIKNIVTEYAPQAIGPYSQAKQVQGFLYLSGQIPLDPKTQTMVVGIEAQVHQSCLNIKAVLEAAGYGFEHVVKTTCFLSDMEHFAAFNAIYAEYFTSKPARSLVAVKTLPKNALVEIEVVAYKEEAIKK